MSRLFLALIATFCYTSLVFGVPTWEGTSQRSIGSLVPGASPIEALGEMVPGQWPSPKYLSVPNPPGVPGNVSVYPNPSPPYFFVRNDQLWQITNDTSILAVNVVNTTGVADVPLKLMVGKKRSGITNGSWRWRGTMLYYEQGSNSNQGVYYVCIEKTGHSGVYMFLKPSPTPSGCSLVTLHSFTRG
ncbi:hypothetical protein JAAARDRAFT_228050 [Jaapia argillacea MUCL 33604]|uniref:Uncharacterized protein n=1 Tax=Jaapia argillacea MUCL 33604 TaxID=933084 RepID=A0A067QPE7_9AGAM|nr:hypothetical protein JAAARDRAFT_228050 [Jaapia argillacea MUCL 33604]